jgi:hypothetical protein
MKAGLAGRCSVCPAPHCDRPTEAAIPSLLAAAQSAQSTWTIGPGSRGPRSHPGHVALESHLESTSNRGRAEHAGDGGKVPRALTETTIAHVEDLPRRGL